jgi:hypothetical protein
MQKIKLRVNVFYLALGFSPDGRREVDTELSRGKYLPGTEGMERGMKPVSLGDVSAVSQEGTFQLTIS